MRKCFVITFLFIIIIVSIFIYLVDKKLVKSESYDLYDNVYSKKSRLLYDFGYILNTNSCLENHKLVLIITSYVGHVELRNAHRNAYSQEFLNSHGIKRVFLLSNIPHNEKQVSQRGIEDESNKFEDIVQGDFLESYRNLTLKHIMGLRWAFINCPTADFILKCDDDMVLNLLNILDYIQKYKNYDRDNFLLGYVFRGMVPIRDKQNKWFVLPSEYKKSVYPPFLSGWMYVTTPMTAARLVSEAYKDRYFWIDDVFVTGILAAKLHIKLKYLNLDSMYLEYAELMDCCISDMNHKNITCEYSVAPNGGHNNKIILFVDALHRCVEKACKARSPQKPLSKTCVASKNNSPRQKGISLIHSFKL